MNEEDLKEIINNINYGKEQQGCYENTYLYFKVSAIESLVNENNQLKERIEYLQRSISRKEETIRDLQDELVETPKESELLNRINKAIEYIEKDYKFANYDIPLLTKDEQLAGKLLELLKGGL